MKKISVAMALSLVVFATACSDTNTTKETTNSADTAVLVNDPANTLDATPINDTTIVADTNTVH